MLSPRAFCCCPLAMFIALCVAVLSALSSADTGIVPCVSRRTGRVQPPPARRQEPLQGGQGHGGNLSAGPAPAVHGTAWGQHKQGEILPACIPQPGHLREFLLSLRLQFL